jgi:hypothetical protein
LGAIVAPAVAFGQDQPAGPSPLETYEGSAPQTTERFKVNDRWEVRWSSMRNVNISVLAPDNTLVAGASGIRGSLYVAKGGVYHLQIDCVPSLPGSPPPATNGNGGSSGLMNTIHDGFNDGSATNSTNPSQNPNQGRPEDPGASYGTRMIRPYRVEVLQIDSDAAQMHTYDMGSFVVPANVMVPTGLNAPGLTTNPAAPATIASTPTPAGPGKLTDDQARAVVLIKGDNAEGTGFMIRTQDGPVVVTNIHVIANNPNLKITTNTGALVTVLGEKGASDRDLAMLSIQDNKYSYLEFSTDISQQVQPGDEVITPGNSQGGEVMLNTPGKVLGIGPERIEIDNPIYHGNSGGPVFHTKSGKVLGVVTEAEKVNTTDDLDKASFASRNSAISNTMRYFALRLDTVSAWVPIDSRQFQIETMFLDQFHEQSRRLDSFLNSTDKNNNPNGDSEGSPSSKLYLSDEKIVKANDRFSETASGSDTAQRIDALRDLLFDLQGIADIDVDQISNMNNFYSFDRERAQDELDYRKALKKELDSFGNNIQRASSLPRSQ